MTQRLWTLKPGDPIRRKALHDEYGGRRQGGIGPSSTTPNVLIFTDPQQGEKYGYYDGWGPDGCFHYTGEGQKGDQQLNQGNGAIAKHAKQGRALRLFKGVSDSVKYVGEFKLAQDGPPYYYTDAPEFGSDDLRQVIVFRLQPKDSVTAHEHIQNPAREAPETYEAQTPESHVESIDLEVQTTEKFIVQPNAAPRDAERREHTLALAYAQLLRDQGHRVSRHKIRPPSEGRPLFTDLYDQTAHELIEAKGIVTREAVRMAVGQLLDYARFLNKPALTLLVPSKPRPDLLDYLASLNIGVVYKEGETFQRV